MHRNVTNIIRFVMDECIPPIIRDARWFMYPFAWYAFKGKNVSRLMEFKSYAHQLTEAEWNKLYSELECIGNDRATDLNSACITAILKAASGKPLKVLDVGCGRGFLSQQLLAQGHEVHGCDVFDRLDIPGLQYHNGSVESLPFPDQSFDLVTCTHTLEHVKNLDKAIAELKRVSRKRIIVVVPRQRPFYYTLDLHLGFFYYKEQLTVPMGLSSYDCRSLGGDWYYEAKVEDY